jgi:hypothetical protein
MLYLRDFQLVLRKHDRDLYGQLSEVWEPVELEIRRAIPPRFNFGGVGKVVLELGAQDRPLPTYRELLNVGLLHIPDFNVADHLALPAAERRAETINIVERGMESLSERFGQAVPWLAPVLSRLRELGA